MIDKIEDAEVIEELTPEQVQEQRLAEIAELPPEVVQQLFVRIKQQEEVINQQGRRIERLVDCINTVQTTLIETAQKDKEQQ